MHGCSGKAIIPVLLDDCHVDSLLRMAVLALCSSGDIWLLWHFQKYAMKDHHPHDSLSRMAALILCSGGPTFAGKSHDVMALKCRGPNSPLNFALEEYDELLPMLPSLSKVRNHQAVEQF